MKITPDQAAARDRIARELATVGLALPGTLSFQRYRCGKPVCRCRADPPELHGPYAQWSRKIEGKTVTRRLGAKELAAYGPLFENARLLRTLVAELQALTLAIVEADDPSAPRTRPETR